jgi:Rieske Fe-S protein
MNHEGDRSGPKGSLTRRRLVNWLLGTSSGAVVAAILYPVTRYIIPPEIPEATTSRVLAGTLTEMAATSWKIFRFGRTAGILVRKDDGSYTAFSATCTHLGCTVQYRPDLRHIWCACHNGEFDLNGVNVAGPPPRPLDRWEVNVSGDEIWVTRA